MLFAGLLLTPKTKEIATMHRNRWIAAAGLGVLLAVAYPVYAHCGRCIESAKEYWKALNDGSQTLVKTVQTAEASGKGKAIAAVPHKHDDGQIHMHVYLLEGDKLTLAMVDAKSGKVVKTEDVKELWSHDDDMHPPKSGPPKGNP
jgi:hypothetical protein